MSMCVTGIVFTQPITQPVTQPVTPIVIVLAIVQLLSVVCDDVLL